MAQATGTPRIFAGSTFSDVKDARNTPQGRALPSLRELGIQDPPRFQAFDLLSDPCSWRPLQDGVSVEKWHPRWLLERSCKYMRPCLFQQAASGPALDRRGGLLEKLEIQCRSQSAFVPEP